MESYVKSSLNSIWNSSWSSSWNSKFKQLTFVLVLALMIQACGRKEKSEDLENLKQFAQRYAAAWGSQVPDSVASFFAEEGVLRVNTGEPARGRQEIARVAEGFMTDLPDMQVLFDSLVQTSEGIEFHWTLIATHSGPGGTGKKVDVSGYEVWQMDPDNFIRESQGYFPSEEYDRQLGLDTVSMDEFIEVDFSDLNAQLDTIPEELSPGEVMKLFYPHQIESQEGNEKIEISETRHSDTLYDVLLIHDNLMDDSLKAKKYVMSLELKNQKWKVTSLKHNWKCWPGRGHESWGTEFCK